MNLSKIKNFHIPINGFMFNYYQDLKFGLQDCYKYHHNLTFITIYKQFEVTEAWGKGFHLFIFWHKFC